MKSTFLASAAGLILVVGLSACEMPGATTPASTEVSTTTAAPKGIMDYYNARGETPMTLGEGYIAATAKGVLSPCTPTSDGPCGFDIAVFVPDKADLTSTEDQPFVLGELGQQGYVYWGPFMGNLKYLVEDAAKISVK
ncbi:hypothetical protein KBD59_04115 [Candidatus Gracilibacteria bacterium]|nr:hypothetical protein [Candidatus Gracilibacteria bacterium]